MESLSIDLVIQIRKTPRPRFNYNMLDFGVLVLLIQDIRFKDELTNTWNTFWIAEGIYESTKRVYD